MKRSQNSTLIFIVSIKLCLTTVNDIPEQSWILQLISNCDIGKNSGNNMRAEVEDFCSRLCYSTYWLFDPG